MSIFEISSKNFYLWHPDVYNSHTIKVIDFILNQIELHIDRIIQDSVKYTMADGAFQIGYIYRQHHEYFKLESALDATEACISVEINKYVYTYIIDFNGIKNNYNYTLTPEMSTKLDQLQDIIKLFLIEIVKAMCLEHIPKENC